jgi:uncharacterized protein (TIGR02217 family)
MTRFVDVYLDPCVPGYPSISVPRWSTRISQVDSGAERANQRWEHPLHTFRLPQAVRDHEVFEAIRDHWLVMRGPVHTFPFRDPLDCASVAPSQPVTDDDLLPTVTATDQAIGTGDGLQQVFQLQKLYQRGSQTYTRLIYHPIVATVVVALNGTPQASGWSVSRTTGEVTFDTPPSPGQAVTAGFIFDVEVRFASDDAFDGIVETYGQMAGFADLEFVEVRPCDDEV